MNTCIRIFADAEQIKQCKEDLQQHEKSITNISNTLLLVGNEVRFKIVFLLHKEKELCPCDLSDILDMTVPAVSQHLRKLKDGGVVGTRKVGQTIFYSLLKAQKDILDPLFLITGNEKSNVEQKVL